MRSYIKSDGTAVQQEEQPREESFQDLLNHGQNSSGGSLFMLCQKDTG